MAATKYTYTKSPVALDRLTLEIQESSIVIALDFMTDTGAATDNLEITFKDTLSGGDQTTLGTVVTNHDGTHLPDNESKPVNITNTEVIVKPKAPSNDYEMKPYGLSHDHINSSNNHIYNITLSNKSVTTYTYSCSAIPVEHDAIVSYNTNCMDEIEEVDTENTTFTVLNGCPNNGDYYLIKPHTFNVKLPNAYPFYQLWGGYCIVKDCGEDDFICMQIVDIDNILGYGAGFVLKEYDEIWAQLAIDNKRPILTPDGAPGELPGGLYVRCLYYPTDVTKTDVKIWLDFILTIAS